jgi:hypothetical protein
VILISISLHTLGITTDVTNDSIKVAIDDIRKANIIFAEYQATILELSYYEQMNSINVAQVTVSDSIITKLELKVNNLDSIIEVQKKLNTTVVNDITARYNRLKRNTIIGGSGVGLIFILLILL